MEGGYGDNSNSDSGNETHWRGNFGPHLVTEGKRWTEGLSENQCYYLTKRGKMGGGVTQQTAADEQEIRRA